MSVFCCHTCGQYYSADEVDYTADKSLNEYCSPECAPNDVREMEAAFIAINIEEFNKKWGVKYAN